MHYCTCTQTGGCSVLHPGMQAKGYSSNLACALQGANGAGNGLSEEQKASSMSSPADPLQYITISQY